MKTKKEEFEIKKASIGAPDFIGTYMIDDSICDDLIDYFKKNERVAEPGKSYGSDKQEGINKDVKESFDLRIVPDERHFPIWDYNQSLQLCLESYCETYPEVNNLKHFALCENYNLQKYPVGGGFKKWHFENSGWEQTDRVLVWMTYLNDVEDGGTEFKYQNFTSPAKKGLTLIWPTYWNFIHRGIVSNTNEKFIITGWYSLVK